MRMARSSNHSPPNDHHSMCRNCGKVLQDLHEPAFVLQNSNLESRSKSAATANANPAEMSTALDQQVILI